MFHQPVFVNRYPHVVHEYNDVRNGRVIGHRPEWNNQEKEILRTIVYDRLRDGTDTNAGSIFEQIFNIYPDWQRREHAIKAKLPDFIKSRRGLQLKRVLLFPTWTATFMQEWTKL